MEGQSQNAILCSPLQPWNRVSFYANVSSWYADTVNQTKRKQTYETDPTSPMNFIEAYANFLTDLILGFCLSQPTENSKLKISWLLHKL